MIRVGDELVELPHDLHPVDRARRVGAPQRAHPHVERERAAGDRGADAAEPDERERASRHRVEPRPRKFQWRGGSCRVVSGMRLAHASTAAITHSEMGSALAPRAHVTIRPS